MMVYLCVREYRQDRTTILGVYSTLELAQTAVEGLVWEKTEDEGVPSWAANPHGDPMDDSLFVIYELVLDNTVDIF